MIRAWRCKPTLRGLVIDDARAGSRRGECVAWQSVGRHQDVAFIVPTPGESRPHRRQRLSFRSTHSSRVAWKLQTRSLHRQCMDGPLSVAESFDAQRRDRKAYMLTMSALCVSLIGILGSLVLGLGTAPTSIPVPHPKLLVAGAAGWLFISLSPVLIFIVMSWPARRINVAAAWSDTKNPSCSAYPRQKGCETLGPYAIDPKPSSYMDAWP